MLSQIEESIARLETGIPNPDLAALIAAYRSLEAENSSLKAKLIEKNGYTALGEMLTKSLEGLDKARTIEKDGKYDGVDAFIEVYLQQEAKIKELETLTQ